MAQAIGKPLKSYHTITETLQSNCFDGRTTIHTSVALECGSSSGPIHLGEVETYFDMVNGVFTLTLRDVAQKNYTARIKIFWQRHFSWYTEANDRALQLELPGRYAGFEAKLAFYHRLFNTVISSEVKKEVVVRDAMSSQDREQRIQKYLKELAERIRDQSLIMQLKLDPLHPTYTFQATVEVDNPVVYEDVEEFV